MNWTHLWIKHQVADRAHWKQFYLLFFALWNLLYSAELGLTLKWKKTHSAVTDCSQVFGVLQLTRSQEHATYTTFNKGQHSNWSDTLIAWLFAAQVQYGLGHYHGHYPVVTNNSICTLYESAITYQSVNYCEIRVTHLSYFPLLSHLLSKWATASRWNFIVYVFIHCEAGITDFTRSFKQMSEYSIDWNVNTGSYWAPVTQLEVQQLSSVSFIVSQRSKNVFLKLLIKLRQPPSGSGDLGKWKTRKWDVDIDCTI